MSIVKFMYYLVLNNIVYALVSKFSVEEWVFELLYRCKASIYRKLKYSLVVFYQIGLFVVVTNAIFN